jgi:flagellar biosynthesis/type III secretory pathway M-ring protein FliF/YscJ
VPVIRRRTSDNSNVSYADNEDTHGRALLRWLLYFLLIVLLFVIIFIIIGYTISNRKSTTTKKKVPKNTTASWMDLPEENELFSFIDTPKKGTDLYFGGNELSTAGKIIIFLLIVGLLVYLFYPMLQTPGIGTVFLVICSCIVLRLFYLLIHKDKTIIDDQG